MGNKAYFNECDITIYNDDFLTTKCIQESSIDLIITSPPYNVEIGYGSFDDEIPYDIYLDFTRRWLEKAFVLLKDDGRICLNIPLDKNKGGQQSVYADIITIAKKTGLQYHTTIIWNEQNISRRTAWGSWMSASAPYIIAPVEMIAVLYKNQWKKKKRGNMKGKDLSDIRRDEFIEWTNGVWNFPGESKKRVGHPAPFPIELPRRCIKMFSYIGDTVLDPFLGSGTTLISCVDLRRKGIGVEIDEKYCEVTKNRLIEEARIYNERIGRMIKNKNSEEK